MIFLGPVSLYEGRVLRFWDQSTQNRFNTVIYFESLLIQHNLLPYLPSSPPSGKRTYCYRPLKYHIDHKRTKLSLKKVIQRLTRWVCFNFYDPAWESSGWSGWAGMANHISALMIQLGRVLGGVGNKPTTFIQLAGA